MKGKKTILCLLFIFLFPITAMGADILIGTVDCGQTVPEYPELIYTGHSDKVLEFYLPSGSAPWLHPPIGSVTIGASVKKGVVMTYNGETLLFTIVSKSRINVYRRLP